MDIEQYLQSSDGETEAEEQDGSGGDERLSLDKEKTPEMSSRMGELAPSSPHIACVKVHSQPFTRPYQNRVASAAEHTTQLVA